MTKEIEVNNEMSIEEMKRRIEKLESQRRYRKNYQDRIRNRRLISFNDTLYVQYESLNDSNGRYQTRLRRVRKDEDMSKFDHSDIEEIQ